MLNCYTDTDGRLEPHGPGASLADAIWVDMLDPTEAERAAVGALGMDVPTQEGMREIEVSNRLYRDRGTDYMTAVLPGAGEGGMQTAQPVCFILSPARLVTVRYHRPRSFETFPARAGRTAAGCGSPQRLFLGLVEEIVGRQADLLEGIGDALDDLLAGVLESEEARGRADLRGALKGIGRQGETLARVRLAVLTMERAVSFHQQAHSTDEAALAPVISGVLHDIEVLGEHGGSLSARIGFANDVTLGMINLEQSSVVRIFSIVAVLFMPPTLVASVYGMNFARMPELASPWGYPLALAAMVVSALVTYLFFKWRHWL